MMQILDHTDRQAAVERLREQTLAELAVVADCQLRVIIENFADLVAELAEIEHHRLRQVLQPSGSGSAVSSKKKKMN